MPESSSNNKRIAKNTILLYFRMIFIMIISLFTSRVNLQSLGVENFGIYNVVGGVVAMFSVFSGSLSVSISRFITFELGKENKERLHKVFSTAVSIQILLAIGITILAEILGIWFLNNKMNIPVERLEAANWVMHFSILTFAVSLISVPYNAAIIAHEKMSAFAYVSVFEVIAKLGITYYLFISPFDKLKTFSVLLFLLSIILRFIYGIYCKRNFQECSYKFVLDKQLLKNIGGFAGWTMFGNLSWVGYTYGTNLLLNLFYDPIVNAARGIAVQVENAVKGFVSNFQMALNPQIIKTYASKELEQMHRLVFASARYSFFLLFFLSLPIIIEAEFILTVWLKIVPSHTVIFIRLILCIMMIDALANPLTVAAQATGKIKVYQIVVGSILLLIVPFSFLALKFGGQPEVVFIVHFIMAAIAQLARLIMIRPMIYLSLRKYFTEVILKIAKATFVSVIFPIGVYLALQKNTLHGFLVVCIVCVCSILCSIYYLGLNKDERLFIINKIKNRCSYKKTL